MIQKQIVLPTELNQQIQKRVRELKEPEAQVIQELLAEGLRATTKDRFSVLDKIRAKNTDQDPAGVVKDITDVVETVRQDLYAKNHAPTGRH